MAFLSSMTLSAETPVVISQTLTVADLGNEAVVLDPTSGMYFGLNEVAARILALAQSSTTIGEIVTQLYDEFDVDRGQLMADVSAFVNDLEKRGMIRVG